MKIGFDGKRAANNLTGLGNYSRSLIEQLAFFFPQYRYFVYTPKKRSNGQIASFLNNKRIELQLPDKNAGLLWRLLGIKKDLLADGVNLFHGLSHELPFGIRKTGIKSVVTIHDLIFLKFPKYYNFPDRIIYTLKSRYACQQADGIIAISERTKQDIIAHYRIRPEKIKVIYQTCDDAFKERLSIQRLKEISKKYNLPKNFILNVGTIENRKNLLSLVKAMKDVQENHTLIVIGKETPYIEKIRKEIDLLKLSDRVKFLKNIPFSDLPGIYQMAKVFVYPSFYEGFGIPIIEALYSNVPVVAATGSCLEEAGGPSSLYADPLDYMELASHINYVLTDEVKRKEMITDGIKFVQKFDAAALSAQLMEYYLQISPTTSSS